MPEKKELEEGDFMDNHNNPANHQNHTQIDWKSAEECSRANCELKELKRSIDWKQGLAIALGVPLLILPSIGYLTNYVWAFSIIIWGLTVLLGFFPEYFVRRACNCFTQGFRTTRLYPDCFWFEYR
ncbi:hypothetical protein [Methanosarcina barkeri]|uniref:hypothetical protein n=1 Tax=Methanosarcina barkeri TaxID=2208 RepID=UPI0006CFCDB4|nr:hypothetical protein [Methanosarcina barkeri]